MTIRLNNGREVLAKQSTYGPTSITYSNRTQAEKCLKKIGDGYEIIHPGSPFYVAKKINEENHEEKIPTVQNF